MKEVAPPPQGIEVVVGTILQEPQGRILLIRQHKWNDQLSCFIGGHVKPAETLADALQREVREEVGLEITDPMLVGVSDSINSSHYERPAHLIFINYVCRVKDTQYRLPDQGEAQEARWVFPKDALALVLDANRIILEQLLISGKLGDSTQSSTQKRR